MQQYGWKLTSGQLEIDWDSDENIRHIQEKVRLLLRGCTCKTGCTSNRCKCKKSGNCCMPSCKCINCKNLPNDSSPPPLNDNPTPLPNDNPPPLTNNTLSDDSMATPVIQTLTLSHFYIIICKVHVPSL